MKTQVYHIGILRVGKTAIIQATKTVDELSCEIYRYYGERETTKDNLKRNKQTILAELKKDRTFERCTKIKVW